MTSKWRAKTKVTPFKEETTMLSPWCLKTIEMWWKKRFINIKSSRKSWTETLKCSVSAMKVWNTWISTQPSTTSFKLTSSKSWTASSSTRSSKKWDAKERSRKSPMITTFSFRNLLLTITSSPNREMSLKEGKTRLTEPIFKELIWLKDITDLPARIRLIWSLQEVLETMHFKHLDKLKKDKDKASRSCSTWTLKECWESLTTNQPQATNVNS